MFKILNILLFQSLQMFKIEVIVNASHLPHVIFYVSFKKVTNVLKQWMRLKLIRLRKYQI